MDPQPLLPDNRCCYCLTLRKGTVLIGLADVIVNIVLFAFYLSSWLNSDGETTTLDIGFFVMFGLQLLCNGLLVLAAVKKCPAFTLPWLTLNVGLIAIFLVLIMLLLFFGSIQTPLTSDQYTSLLSTLGFLGAILLFSWLIVFQFRKNLIEEKRILSTYVASAPLAEDEMPQSYRRPPSPPPSYEDVAKLSMSNEDHKAYKKVNAAEPAPEAAVPAETAAKKGSFDELPPEYSAAVTLTPEQQLSKAL